MKEAKKKFPKLKKSLNNFLTDESWKITKKSALGISAGAFLLAGAEDLVAWHTSRSCATHLNQWHASWYNAGSHLSSYRNAHGSGIVNGHYSWTPSWWHASGTRIWSHLSQGHASWCRHASHGSHGSHSSCGRGCW